MIDIEKIKKFTLAKYMIYAAIKYGKLANVPNVSLLLF